MNRYCYLLAIIACSLLVQCSGRESIQALQQKIFKAIANWVLGGFSMGIVTGNISTDGKTYNVYGLGELLI